MSKKDQEKTITPYIEKKRYKITVEMPTGKIKYAYSDDLDDTCLLLRKMGCKIITFVDMQENDAR